MEFYYRWAFRPLSAADLLLPARGLLGVGPMSSATWHPLALAPLTIYGGAIALGLVLDHAGAWITRARATNHRKQTISAKETAHYVGCKTEAVRDGADPRMTLTARQNAETPGHLAALLRKLRDRLPDEPELRPAAESVALDLGRLPHHRPDER
ncbi:hypothetical protein [Streptomyces bohaiensis]|uniref:hypothetical protein n=1 Tax=Streptomyces bohaiensis TaxID=1431344 RepID=UPI003B772CA3